MTANTPANEANWVDTRHPARWFARLLWLAAMVLVFASGVQFREVVFVVVPMAFGLGYLLRLRRETLIARSQNRAVVRFRNVQQLVAAVLWAAFLGFFAMLLFTSDTDIIAESSGLYRLPLALGILAPVFCQCVMIPIGEAQLDEFRNRQLLADWSLTADEMTEWNNMAVGKGWPQLRSSSILVADSGVCFGGRLQSWSWPGSWVERVAIESDGSQQWIDIVIAGSTRNGGIRHSNIRIPIPVGNREEARTIREHIAQKVSNGEQEPLAA